MSTNYVCQACGASYLKWSGKCDVCQVWNTLTKETPLKVATSQSSSSDPLTWATLVHANSQYADRWKTHCGEFDRVCGGGIVPGSVVVLGGEPGIGKSTLLLQILAGLPPEVKRLYISGEEGLAQIALRAQRLGLTEEQDIRLGVSTSVEDIVGSLRDIQAPAVVVIDSIQTMVSSMVSGLAGTLTQIRASAQEFTLWAKKSNCAIILVGHVTKEGLLAGPKVLEHMVDAVLSFEEGERSHRYRLLRATKNRFGPTDEVGVFKMGEKGLCEISNPSQFFLTQRPIGVPGSAVFPSIEGARPLFIEVQALVSPSFFAAPRRAVVGWDPQRLEMILAVLEKRCNLSLNKKDVYIKVVGGLRIQDPGADVAIAAALASCVKNIPLPTNVVFLGEVGLSGEIRTVSQQHQRLKEAALLGFSTVVGPREGVNDITNLGIEIIPLKMLSEMVIWLKQQGT